MPRARSSPTPQAPRLGPRGRRVLRAGAAAVALVGCAGSVHAATDTILIDAQLGRQSVTLRQVGRDGVVYVDRLGLERTTEPGRLLALVRDTADRESQATSWGLVELTDGQRLRGRLASGEGAADALAWEHPLLGRVSLALDRVDHLMMPGARAGIALGPDSEDAIALRHGDVLRGFVESIGATSVIEIDGQRALVGSDRVHSVRLANPRERSSGAMVFFAGGEVLRVLALADGEPGRLGFEPEARGTPGGDAATIVVSMREVEAVVFDAAAVRPLAELDRAGGGAEEDQERVRVGRSGFAPDVEFVGPGRVSWVLPQGATRFACTLSLPESEWAWGDCEVRLLVEADAGEVEMLDARLHAGAPTAEWVTDLPAVGLRGRVLTIEVRAGAHGPIQDRPVVQQALVAIQPG